jgi:hypothetical protein
MKGVLDANIWNMDETGNAMGPYANQTILGSVETNRSYVTVSESRE